MTFTGTIRPYQAGDEPGLLSAWNEAMWADPIDDRAWRARYLLDPCFDPDSCLVADLDGAVAGFVLGMRHPGDTPYDAWVVGFGVRSDHRRQGIGNALFSTLETTWRTGGVRRVIVGPWIPHYVTPGIDVSAYPEAIAFIESRGGQTDSRPLSMKASLTGYRPAPNIQGTREELAKHGVEVRTVEPGDVLPLLAFLDVDFPHWRGDATGVLHEQFGGDPTRTTMHIALDHGRVVGYAQSRGERFGPFGVSESQRGRGIGAVLLSQTLHAMRARGYHCAWFLWTSDRAARLYHQHGFEEVRRFALMHVALNGDAA